MSKKSKRNNDNGFVYSTNNDFDYDAFDNSSEEETLEPGAQDLRVWLDRKSRAGKTATILKGFVGTEDDLKALAKSLKTACSVGGNAKNGEIILQGDVRDRVLSFLDKKGYRAKKAGG